MNKGILSFHNLSVAFMPDEFEEHIHRVGNRQVVNKYTSKIYDEAEGRNGGDLRHFIFLFNFSLSADEKNKIEEIFLSYPSVRDPAILEWNGKAYGVIFSPIQQAFDFPDYVEDDETGKKYYHGSMVLMCVNKIK